MTVLVSPEPVDAGEPRRRYALLFALVALFALGVLFSALLQPAKRNLYLIRDEGTHASLVTMPRRLYGADTAALAHSAVLALAQGPLASERQAGLGSEVPATTVVLHAELTAGVLRVDLSAAVVGGGGASSMQGRLMQLRYSLIELPGVSALELWVEGAPAPLWGGEGLVVAERWERPAGEPLSW